MKLRERLAEPFGGLKRGTLDILEPVVEDFAISFAEWLGLNCYNDFGKWKMYEDDDAIFEIKQLLEIYKKEMK